LDGVMNAVAGRRVVERRLCDTCGVGIGGGDVFRPRYFAIVAVGALLAAAAVGLAVATAHEPRAHPRKIWVGFGGLFIRASLGSHC
jgi:hypothetical protein